MPFDDVELDVLESRRRSVVCTSKMSAPKTPDLLDNTVAFLAKRDGIDKTLKIIRYTTRFVLASALKGQDTDLAQRLRRFESSIGTSRKAYRLGKFLGDVNALRKTPLHAPYATLEWLAAGGECIYYFTDQLQWLIKAGLLPDRYAAQLTLVSNWGELVGYVGSITLALLRISALLERELALLAELQRQRQKLGETASEEDRSAAKALVTEIRLLRARRLMRTLGLVQDLADLLMVLADLRQSKRGLLGNAAAISLAGLVSGCLSAYKNWPSTQK